MSMIAQQLSAKPVQLVATKKVSSARKVAVITASGETSRRAAVSLAVAGALTLLKADRAEAKFTNPAQDSTGGTTKANNRVSSSLASASSYDMEGTRKTGVTSKRKAAILAKVPRN
eukprot:CAMPEP_0118931860 /NCGR_PEP_ID=MMETSP1169-20130426/8392_1 /TAXON_ID=36882 /ORGANISM="Pyramimonas obovata, Strain CCMP722" /LENGTH=115 /DNA_ID=CAMNT_0006874415 /DNA_START=63 /DNA_END=410 /DNA_ORIENTATION=+